MRPVLILQNDPIVPPGTIIDYLEEHKVAYQLVKTYSDENWGNLDELRALIILGSPKSAMFYSQSKHLSRLFNFIREAIAVKLPVLGICFGSQLLAMAHGAVVTRGRTMELGRCQVELTNDGMDDPVFRGFSRYLNVFHFHQDRWQLPNGAFLLATNDVCANQAFRSDKSVGIQFHPEVNLEIIKSWCEKFGSSLEANQKTAEEIIGEYKEMAEELREQNYRILENFLKHTETKKPGLL